VGEVIRDPRSRRRSRLATNQHGRSTARMGATALSRRAPILAPTASQWSPTRRRVWSRHCLPVTIPRPRPPLRCRTASSRRPGSASGATARNRAPWSTELAAAEVRPEHSQRGGRATFGAGLGSQALQEYEAFGEQGDAKVRAERLDEALEVVVGLWSGAPFTYQGKYYTVTNGQFLPRPVQQPRIPVWIAGRWPARRPFARAARWDGVFPTHVDVGPASVLVHVPGQNG
jgi:hypothetical protein